MPHVVFYNSLAIIHASMNRYLDKLDQHLGNIQRTAEEEDDPDRSKILWNYLHHGAFELAGDWERIFTPEMIVDDPHYEMRAGQEEPLVLDGQEAVKEFYSLVEDEHLMLVDDGNHQLFVNDDGMAEFATTVEFTTGRAILDEGTDKWHYNETDINDPDATYVKTCRHGQFWPYDEDRRLIGEMVYQVTPFDVEKAASDEVPTPEDVATVAKQYFPENVDGSSPFEDVSI